MRNERLANQLREARERHRSQVRLHIFLPLLLLALLALGIVVLIIAKGEERIGALAALATIWLILPVLCLGGVFLALLSALIYLLTKALIALPGIAQQAQLTNCRLQTRARRFADGITQPFFRFHEGRAMLQAIGKALRSVILDRYGGSDGRDAFLED
ncbi:MAG: hypothetical protein ACK8QZ_01975 [Anaerolineales bacterium]